MSVGERISKLRKDKKLSQYQLASILGVSRQAISKWENGLSEPDTLHLIHIADILSCNVEYLATGKEPTPPNSPAVVTIEKVIERPVEVVKIVEKPVEIEKIIYLDKFHETIIEKPIVRRVIRTKTVRNPLEYLAVLILGLLIGLIIGVLA